MQIEDAVRALILHTGDDPDRAGLRGTPSRVESAYAEWFSGYGADIPGILETTFKDECKSVGVESFSGLILLKDYPLTSTCEHHMCPFTGTADVGYLPAEGKGVVGLSKLGRLVDVYARRLQVQERIAAQVVDALETYLQPRGTIVRLTATHHCMTTRGVGAHSAVTTTILTTGELRDNPLRAQEAMVALNG